MEITNLLPHIKSISKSKSINNDFVNFAEKRIHSNAIEKFSLAIIDDRYYFGSNLFLQILEIRGRSYIKILNGDVFSIQVEDSFWDLLNTTLSFYKCSQFKNELDNFVAFSLFGYNTSCESSIYAKKINDRTSSLPDSMALFFRNFSYSKNNVITNLDLEISFPNDISKFSKAKDNFFVSSGPKVRTNSLEISDSLKRKNKYTRSVEIAKKYIADGEIYQVNLAQEFAVEINKCKSTSWEVFKKFKENSGTKYSYFISMDDFSFASCTPERFLKREENKIITQPIKGTSSSNVGAEALMSSTKEEAELAMIVDLARNDLAKSAIPGSIKVEEFKVLEKYPNVFHLHSTISARVLSSKPSTEIIEKAFPPASVTGCPKIRALEIINELEEFDRNFYCGAVGVMNISGDFDLSVSIRAFVCVQNIILYYAGSGIVFESEPEKEYLETFYKAAPFLRIF